LPTTGKVGKSGGLKKPCRRQTRSYLAYLASEPSSWSISAWPMRWPLAEGMTVDSVRSCARSPSGRARPLDVADLRGGGLNAAPLR